LLIIKTGNAMISASSAVKQVKKIASPFHNPSPGFLANSHFSAKIEIVVEFKLCLQ
jgi:hypothetical protein